MVRWVWGFEDGEMAGVDVSAAGLGLAVEGLLGEVISSVVKLEEVLVRVTRMVMGVSVRPLLEGVVFSTVTLVIMISVMVSIIVGTR